MGLQDTGLRSSVVRRVVGSFALAALLPALVTGGVAYYAVERQLVDKSLDQLRQESKHYGLFVLQELQLAAELLPEQVAGDYENSLRRYFLRVVEGSTAPDTEHRPGTLELEVRREHGATSVWLTHTSEQRRVSGMLNPAVLWGTPDTFPPSTTYCVLDELGRELFCPATSEGAIAVWQAALERSSVGTFSWQENDSSFMGGYFTVPLRPSFTSEGWSVAAIQAESEALAAMAGFRAVFPAAMALTALLALWVGYHQVRRRLRPLRALTEATTNMAGGDFSTRLELDGDAEFLALAEAFNSMGDDLARQFRTLTALSELDRQILSTNGIQPIAEAAVRHMLDVFGCQCAGVVAFDKDAHDVGQIIWCDENRQIDMRRIDARSAARLSGTELGFLESDASFLGPMRERAEAFVTSPVNNGDELVAIVALGYAQREGVDVRAAESLRDFGDRLAVALQAVDRAEQLYRKAHYDGLTSLPNRQLFRDRLERVIAQCLTHGHTAALLFVDLDHFKTVNDSEGHSVGDALLRLAAERLGRVVGSAETIARLGGDEFTVILSEIPSPLEALRAADNIVTALSEPFVVDVMEHYISASVGIAIVPTDGDSVETLLRNADTALYKAKELGRKRCVFFEERMNRNAEERVLLGADLQHAIERDELVLHYQPKLDLESGQVVGAEALVRWRHPTRGLVPPSDFVPIAEDTGVIVEIGHWVMCEAVRQLAVWRRAGLLDKVSVNVSYRQMRDGDILSSVAGALRDHGLEASSLEVEFTESLLAEDRAMATAMLSALRSAGVSVAIDDFGTGYSSLSYVAELPFDTIKLDRSFLNDFPRTQESTAIVSGIVQIATLLGKTVVAEGIERTEQRTALLRHGCTVGQGYLFSPPLAADAFAAFVAKAEKRRAG